MRIMKIKKSHDNDGKEIQHTLFDTGYSFQIHHWDESTSRSYLIDETNYEGHSDRLAARAMAQGAQASLHQQVA